MQFDKGSHAEKGHHGDEPHAPQDHYSLLQRYPALALVGPIDVPALAEQRNQADQSQWEQPGDLTCQHRGQETEQARRACWTVRLSSVLSRFETTLIGDSASILALMSAAGPPKTDRIMW